MKQRKQDILNGSKSNCRNYSINTPIKPINNILPSVNWHITKKCNFDCKYCFAGFKDVKGMLPKEIALEIPRQLKDLGVEKLNFAGGEPMLYPHLMEVLKEAKSCGLTVSMVSNGSLLDPDNISEISCYLDWIGLSLDSCNEDIQNKLGRGPQNHVSNTVKKAQLIKEHEIGLKINTVVTKLNLNEDMRPLIRSINPERWKVFQVMKREGENHNSAEPLLITQDEFERYKERNDMVLENGSTPKFESNELMKKSYLMLDPLGRFFHSANGPIEYIPTDPTDLASSIKKVPFDHEAFEERGGRYDWERNEFTMGNADEKSSKLMTEESI